MKTIVKNLLLCLFVLALSVCANALQQPTRQSLEAKKKQLAELRSSVEGDKKKVVQLKEEAHSLEKRVDDQEKIISQLEDEVANQADEVAFQESPARTILDVVNAKTFLIDFNGTRRFVILHGIAVEESKDAAIVKTFKKRLVRKTAYIRCAMPNVARSICTGTRTVQA
jgi:hypothetical protein